MEYSERIERQIDELLATRNRVTPGLLPGIPDDEGAALLEHYATVHGEEKGVVWDGVRLVRERQPTSLAETAEETQAGGAASDAAGEQAPSTANLSPVDQVLAAPASKSLLDTKPAAPVSAWIWLLPLGFGLPGGVLAWLLVRDTNRGVARTMLVVSAIVTVVSVVMGVSLRGAFERIGSIVTPGG